MHFCLLHRLAKCSSTFCFIQDRVVIHRMNKQWITQILWLLLLYFFNLFLFVPHTFFQSGVIGRCCTSLFGQVSITWKQWQDWTPAAAYVAPLSVSLNSEKAGRWIRDLIYYEKRLNENHGAAEINTKHEESSLWREAGIPIMKLLLDYIVFLPM